MSKRLIVILAIAICICTLALIGVQIKWVQTMVKVEEEFFSRNMCVVLQHVVHDVDRMEMLMFASDNSQPVRSFQLDLQTYTNNRYKPVEERCSKPLLDSLINAELKRHGIVMPFEYAVTDELGKIIIATNGFIDVLPEYTYNATLFPNIPYDVEHYSLNVYLPHQFSHIMYSLRWIFIVPVLITLIITGTFACTLTVIFKQKQWSKIKNDFISNITHELKTPISTILLASEMLQDPAATGNNKYDILRLSRMIDSEGKRLLLLVDQVLQSAIFERGKLKLAVEETNVHELIQQVLAQFTLQFNTLHVTVECCLNAANTQVMADEVHLANALSNMIDNAIKYRKESKPLHIVITTANKQNRIVISITDNGAGIDNHTVKHLFEQFYRGYSRENNFHIKGFGLGLYYVKNIIETHNGRLFASGNHDEGSTFGFELPVVAEKGK